jgi:predicted O-linked N-acetylglucosamine transferase (SPINDLY family)
MVTSLEDRFKLAMAALQAGRLDDAERFFKKLLQRAPKDFGTLNLLGVALMQRGKHAEAERYVKAALAVNARNDVTLSNYGIILKALKRPQEALERFSQALAINPGNALAWNNRGTALNDLGRYDEAVSDFDKAIALDGNFADAYCNKGNSLSRLKRYDEALAAYDRALAIRSDIRDAWLGRGNVLRELKRYDHALSAYDKLLGLNTESGAAWVGRGNVLFDLRRHEEAVAAYDRVLAVQSDCAEAWVGRGNVLFVLKKHDEAQNAFDAALSLEPDLADAWLGRGNACVELRRHGDAVASYQKALDLRTEFPAAWLGIGNAFFELKRPDEALTAYDRSLALNADLAEGWLGRGNALVSLGKHRDAVAAFDKALAIRPDLDYAEGNRLHAKQLACDWTNLDLEVSHLLSVIGDRSATTAPFTLLPMASSEADRLRCAANYVARQPAFPPLWRGERYSHDRIRVAYLSADFREHPVAYAAAGMFELHDRSRFEVTGISLGTDQDSDMRRRLKESFEHFIDAEPLADEDVAALMQRREIDIAVDLTGLTQGLRLGIAARRPAPIQVNYLGYSATMGADYIDYIIGDATIISVDRFAAYSERVVWLPESFMANDNRRAIADLTPTRAECGLPETGFVFCCFNNAFKLTPGIFDIWMRLLRAKSDSILWLSAINSTAMENLRREAEARGVEPQRLIFAPQVPIEEHLARHRQADLFLDTLPYNAHTTAADALWAGLPVVTCVGDTFPARVAGSLLNAIGLPELITTSLSDYEVLALKLTNEPPLLASLKAKLARNRDTTPLFDTERFTRHLEHAYVTMVERYQRGERPAPFAVAPID